MDAAFYPTPVQLRRAEILRSMRAMIADGPVTADTMAMAAKISVRQVYRYVAMMKAAGDPIVGESGVGYMMMKKRRKFMRLNTIWEFPIEIADRQAISMPKDYSILSVGLDPAGVLCLWALVTPPISGNEMRDVEIRIVGTGNPVPHVGSFLGTVRVGPFMWHVFTGPGDSANRPAEMAFHYLTSSNG